MAALLHGGPRHPAQPPRDEADQERGRRRAGGVPLPSGGRLHFSVSHAGAS
ncbi:hypothetical protein L665_02775 [Ralstonia solanacearum SD54]|nr:hypothetical protein L665_02775 [Ralstonia solanacearum SD54]